MEKIKRVIKIILKVITFIPIIIAGIKHEWECLKDEWNKQ